MPFPPFQQLPGHVHRFSISREQFAKLPKDARVAAIVLGNIANEIATLYRVIILSSQSPSHVTDRSYQTVQFTVLSRLLIGKVAEGCQFFKNRLLSQRDTRDLVASIEAEPEGKALVRSIKASTSGSGLLARIRNEHIFHHPADEELESAFQRVGASDADWSFLTAEQAHTLCFPAANTIGLLAMLNEAHEDNLAANERLSTETMEAAGSLLEFAQAFYVALQNKYDLVDLIEPVRDVTTHPLVEDAQIPPILRST